MPRDRTLHLMNGANRLLQRASRGRLGWSFRGMPVLELTTTGRRSGKPHSAMLTSPMRFDGAFVIVASRGGDDTHPDWFLNLRANPDVTVTLEGGEREPMTARVATPEERERLWPQVTSKYPFYGGYQKRTEREIPLVLLTSVGAGESR